MKVTGQDMINAVTKAGQEYSQLDAFQAEIARLKAENAKLKSTKSAGLSIKIGKSGGVSVYGLGRFPVTLYKTQWEKLFGGIDAIQAFIKANESDLKVKDAA